MSGNATNTPRWISGIEPSREMLATNGTQILEIECRQQPLCLADLLKAYSDDPEIRSQLNQLREKAKASGPINFIGMGASLCSSFGGSVLLQSSGRPAFSLDAGEWLHYSRPLWNSAALSILLTTSGESAELVELQRHMNSESLGLVCNNPASTCWSMAGSRLPILAGPEYGNATKTYINATAASIVIASEILDLPWQDNSAIALEVFAKSLTQIFATRGDLELFCRGAANIEVIGRGAAYGAAVMSALTIREMSGFRAAAHTGAGFRHGPNLDVDHTHVAIIFALGRVSDLGVKLALECNRRGGKVVLVSDEDHESTDKLLPVKLDPVPEPWEGITSIIAAQALTLAMIERNGCRLPPRFQYGVMEQ